MIMDKLINVYNWSKLPLVLNTWIPVFTYSEGLIISSHVNRNMLVTLLLLHKRGVLPISLDVLKYIIGMLSINVLHVKQTCDYKILDTPCKYTQPISYCVLYSKILCSDTSSRYVVSSYQFGINDANNDYECITVDNSFTHSFNALILSLVLIHFNGFRDNAKAILTNGKISHLSERYLIDTVTDIALILDDTKLFTDFDEFFDDEYEVTPFAVQYKVISEIPVYRITRR